MTPEQFDKLNPAAKSDAITADELDREWWGNCLRCGHRIKTKLRVWPAACPNCGYHGPDDTP